MLAAWKIKFLIRVRPAALAVWLKRLLKVERCEVKTKYGNFWVDPVSDFGSALYFNEEYEVGMIPLLRQHLKSGDTFIDVGANEGFFSLLAAAIVGPQGRVLAIEPQSRLIAVMQKNMQLNGQPFEIAKVAVSDHEGTAEFFLSPDVNSGSSALARNTKYQVETEIVEVMTLAEVLRRHQIGEIALMKMDIEGYEYEAVLGSRSLFEEKRVKCFLLEYHPRHLSQRNKNIEHIGKFMNDVGYELSTVNGHTVYRPREA